MEAWAKPEFSKTMKAKREFWGERQDEDVDIGGRWVDHLERWEKGGRKGGRPPGVGTVKRESEPGKREWIARKSSYLLRPEVRTCDCPLMKGRPDDWCRPSKVSILWGRLRAR
jgi:hypothetical protein